MPRYVIPNIPSFKLIYDAGDMAIIALETVLRTAGISYPFGWLASISGDAFKFIYDRGAVFEPMRDRVPVDILSIACSSIGIEAGWIIDEPIDKVREVVESSLRRGSPILAPYLSETYHGISIITGIDTENEKFLVQFGKEDQDDDGEYSNIDIPDRWDGPVPGPIIWADSPIFTILGKKKEPNKNEVISDALKRAVELFHGEPLPYSNHPGAQEYSVPPLKERVVAQGLQAFKELMKEVRETEIINWGVIWRMDAQCGQLAYDRLNASRFIKYLAETSKYQPLRRVAEVYRETSMLAMELKRIYWDNRWTKTNRKMFREKVENTDSFVYQIPNFSEEDLRWIRRVLPVQDTLWGPAVIVNGARRRGHAENIIKKIINNEEKAIGEIQAYINQNGGS